MGGCDVRIAREAACTRACQGCLSMGILCLQASGLAGKTSVALMGYDVTHSGKKGQMTIAEATQ